jgi:hypothetical protein
MNIITKNFINIIDNMNNILKSNIQKLNEYLINLDKEN